MTNEESHRSRHPQQFSGSQPNLGCNHLYSKESENHESFKRPLTKALLWNGKSSLLLVARRPTFSKILRPNTNAYPLMFNSSPLKHMMVGRLLSFWYGRISGAILNFQEVCTYIYIYVHNLKHTLQNGCFNWMIPNLYIKDWLFHKHGCLEFQVQHLDV